MTDRLRLTLAPADEGTAELHAEVVARGFSGRGSAWFNLSELAEFANTLGMAFPLQEAIELRGGCWGKEPGVGLTQELLAVRFYPIGSRGVIGCQVRLATPVQEHDRSDAQYAIRIELTTQYQELQQFSSDMLSLINEMAREVVLKDLAV